MKKSIEIKHLLYLLVIVFSISTSLGQTYFKVYDCSLKYSKIENGDTAAGRMSMINNISEFILDDTVSIMICTKTGKNILIDYKNVYQLLFYNKSNAGKSVGYGALIGFAAGSIPLFLLGLADKDADFGTVAIVSGLGGVLGGLIGALTGLLISSAGNEPDILDISMPLTNTEKQSRIIKFFNRLKN